jgi:hypothetical protein
MSERKDRIDQAKALKCLDELGRRGIKLKKEGHEHKGPCPKCGGTDRFAVNDEKNSWNCRICEKGGGTIQLVQHLDGADFDTAVTTLVGPEKTKRRPDFKNPEAVFDYHDAAGKLIYQSVRLRWLDKNGAVVIDPKKGRPEKTFRQRLPGGRFKDGLNGLAKVPYHLHKVTEALAAGRGKLVFFVEGEAKADLLWSWNLVATSVATKTENFAETFRGTNVVVLPDNDDKGERRANFVLKALHGIAARLRVVRLPGLGDAEDVKDWAARGGDRDKLLALVESTNTWVPTMGPSLGVDDDDDDTDEKEKKPKQANILIELALAEVKLFRTGEGVAYADIHINGHRETWSIRTKGFKNWLSRRFYQETKGAPSSDAMNAALGIIDAEAQFNSPVMEVHVRIAGLGDSIYLDLGDTDWRAVEVDAQGWRLCNEPPVRFRRPKGMLPLEMPRKGGSVHDLREFLNVKTNNDFVLVVAWLLAALRNYGPYPVVALAGVQGSAKTTLMRLLRALIDPHTLAVRSLPKDHRDLFISARNTWVLAYDNVSHLSQLVSDGICTLSTGGGHGTRQLFTDDEEAIHTAQRPVVINGIEDVVTMPDLADRTVFLTLERMFPPWIMNSRGERSL